MRRFDLTTAHELAEAACYSLSPGPVAIGCVDGRYHETRRPLRRPGANAGEVLDATRALRTLNSRFEPTDCWDAIIDSVGGESNFHYHSDTNSECIYSGCGHIASMIRTPEDYGVRPDDVTFLCRQLHLLSASGMQPLRLHGLHRERMVFFMESETHALFSQASGTHFFVFHRTLNGLRLNSVAGHVYSRIKAKNPGLTKGQVAQAIKQAANANLQMTFGKVALGLPQFTVAVSSSGHVEVHPVMVATTVVA